MTFTTQTHVCRKTRKSFLILPVIATDFPEKSQEILLQMPVKNKGVNLFIKTWPQKLKKKNSKDLEENRRPLTATLEKPMILDVRLVKKIDMSKMKKEFLNISSLCRIPLLLKSKKSYRPLSLPPPDNKKSRNKKVSEPDDSWEDEESISIKSTSRIRNNKSEGESLNNEQYFEMWQGTLKIGF